jgi:hypothetical protein
MVVLGVALLFGIAFAGIALKANVHFRGEKRLPMQWWVTGEVVWSAPRVFALAFIPAIAMCAFGAYVGTALNVPPSAEQEGMVLPSLLGLGVIFLGTQVFHLWMVEKTLRRNGN